MAHLRNRVKTVVAEQVSMHRPGGVNPVDMVRENGQGRECKVLLAESDPAEIKRVCHALAEMTEHCVEVVVVETLDSALDALEADTFSLILLDLNPPDCSGLDTLRRIREGAGCAAIIVLASDHDEVLAIEAIKAGAQDYLVKAKLPGATLLRVLNYALEHQRFVNERELNLRNLAAAGMNLGKLLDCSTDGMLVVDADGIVRFANPSAEAMFKCFDKKVIGSALPEQISLRENAEIELDFADGCGSFVESRVVEFEWNGEPARLIALRNITRRKRAQDALRENERRLSTLLSNLPGMAYRCRSDNHWTMEFVSDGAFALTGYRADQIVGAAEISYASIIHPDDREQIWNDVQTAVGDRKPFQLTYRITTATGEERWIRELGRGVFSESGALEALEGIATDITERKHTLEALRESEQRFQDFASASSDWLWEMGADLRFTWLSERICECTGLPLSHFIGRTRREIGFTDGESEKWERHLADLDAHRPFRDFCYGTLNGAGEERYFCISGIPLFDDDGTFAGYRGVGTDATATVRGEKEAERARNLLVDAIEGVSDGFALFDAWDRLILCNSSYREALEPVRDILKPGVRWETLLRTLVKRGAVVPPDPAMADTWLEEQIDAHGRQQALRRLRTSDGRWIEARDFPTRDGGVVILRSDVTDRIAWEHELRATNARMQAVLDNIDYGVLFVGADLRVQLANPAFRRFWEIPDEMLHRMPSVEEMIARNTQRGLYQIASETPDAYVARRTQEVRDGEEITTDIVLCDGRTLRFHLTALPDGGRMLTYFDLTEIKEREEDLRRSEVGLATAQRIANIGSWEMIVDQNRFTLSKQLCRILGREWSERPVDRDAFFGSFHPDDRASVCSALDSALSSGASCRMDHRIVNSDEAIRYVRQEGEVVRNCDGTAISMIATMQDVTERVEAEKVLLTLSQAIEQSPTSVVITGIDGTIEYVNPKFEEITGYSAAEAIGQNPRILNSGETSPEAYSELWKVIGSGGTWRGEFHNRKKNGELFWEFATVAPIKAPDGMVIRYLAVKEDITERKSMEQRLAQSQKMEAVGQLTGGVAHDFNNLLTVVVGSLGLVREHFDGDDRLRKLLDNAYDAGKRGADLVNGLLAFSRTQTLRPEKLNLNDTVPYSVKLLGRTLGGAVKVNFVPGVALGMVHCDPVQLQNALFNLAINARDAMPEGGVVTIETDNVTIGPEAASFGEDVTPGRYVKLVVGDTGTGMSAEVITRVFEPFFTTKEIGKGSGLGLSMVHGFVKQSGGHVEISSKEGQGTAVKLFFPRVAGATDTRQDTVSEVPSSDGSETILVVEDDVHVRDISVTMLVSVGYQVLQAETGLGALEVLADHSEVALVLSDVVMPGGMNGVELAQLVRKRYPETKVLLTSGYTRDFMSKHGDLDDDIELLPKPFDGACLANKVKAVLQQTGNLS